MPGYDNYALQTFFGKVVMVGVGGLYSDAFYSTDYATALLTFHWSYDATLKAIPAPVSGGQVIFGISPNMVTIETPSGLSQQGWSGWPADVARTKYAPWTIAAATRSNPCGFHRPRPPGASISRSCKLVNGLAA